MTKVLILGAYGMLGHRLLLGLDPSFDIYGTCRERRKDPWAKMVPSKRLISGVDALDLERIRKTLKRAHPDVVVNCIGVIKQLDTAKDPLPSISINSLLPHHLAVICKDGGSMLKGVARASLSTNKAFTTVENR